MTAQDQTPDEVAVLAHSLLQSMTLVAAAARRLRRAVADGEESAHEELLNVVILYSHQVIDAVRDLRFAGRPDVDLTAIEDSVHARRP